jgi:hypothetical protein
LGHAAFDGSGEEGALGGGEWTKGGFDAGGLLLVVVEDEE